MNKRTLYIINLMFAGTVLWADTVGERIKQALEGLYTSEDRSISRRTIKIILECGGVVENPCSEDRPSTGPDVIGVLDAWEHIGEVKTVEGVVRYIANNRREVCIGFKNPHQGNFAVLVRRGHWSCFPQQPDTLINLGDTIRVTGKIVWYQGDPVMWNTDPDAIRMLKRSSHPSTGAFSQQERWRAGAGGEIDLSCVGEIKYNQ